MSLDGYRGSGAEQERARDLLDAIGQVRGACLEVGARDGRHTRHLAQRCGSVVALDIVRPAFDVPGVPSVQADVTALPFRDASFETVVCAEVLEHVPDVPRACAELMRVARARIVVGVPYRQDLRVGRTTCRSCGKQNPPWGHRHSFDERRLRRLFRGCRVESVSFVGERREASNPLTAGLMSLAGNPWGAYHQEEPCVYCGARLVPPATRSLGSRIAAGVAHRLQLLQRLLTRGRPAWMHVVLAPPEREPAGR